MNLPGSFSIQQRRVRFFLLALLLTVTAVLTIDSLRRETVTFDEPLHLTAGYSFWRFNDYRLQVSHGALPQRLFALPLLFSDLKFPDRSSPAWRKPGYLALGPTREFVFGSSVDPSAIIFRGRLMAVGIALLTVVAVYAWAGLLFGPATGLIAAFFCALSPTILAHGRLMSSDLIAALFFLMSAGCFWMLLRRFTWWRLAASSCCFGLLMVSKMSGALFVFMALLMLLTKLALKRPWRACFSRHPAEPLRSMRGKLGLAGGVAITHALIALAVIWTFYGWQQKPAWDWNTERDDYTEPRAEVFSGLGTTQPLFEVLERTEILPDAYLYGLAHTVKNSVQRPSFLNGEYSGTGWWYYFPYCFLVKTSPALLALLALGIVFLCWQLLQHPRRRRQLVWLDKTSLLWSILIVSGLAAVSTNLNIGHRHLLPFYPPLFILVGAAGYWLWRRSMLTRGILALLLVGQVVVVASIHPHYLAYFNTFAGGPENGYRHLTDSNVDWGQDLPQLARWLEDNRAKLGTENVYVGYFGLDLPPRLGIKAIPLPSISNPRLSADNPITTSAGTYCISATTLINPSYGRPAWGPDLEKEYVRMLAYVKEMGRTNPPRRSDPANMKMWGELLNGLSMVQFHRLRSHLIDRKPDAMIGYSILIYHLSDAELREAILPK